jgi:hypothetical protein
LLGPRSEGCIAFFNVMDPDRAPTFLTKPPIAMAQDAIDYFNKAWFSEGESLES